MTKEKNIVDKTTVAGGETEKFLQMYRRMVAIRLFEEQVNDLYTRALMPGLAHLYIGEEAVAVGICSALDRMITSQARIAAMVTVWQRALHRTECSRNCWGKNQVIAEEKADQCTSRIRKLAISAPMRSSLEARVLPLARRSPPNGWVTVQRCVCFFGEGALGQGVLYEAMNIAQLWKLPVIYVCENNHYNEYTHYSETTAGDILARPKAFGIHAESVDGQDVRAVYSTARNVVERARKGEGPVFLLCNTYRYRGHHVGDINREYYRTKKEEQKWMAERDPIKILKRLAGCAKTF